MHLCRTSKQSGDSLEATGESAADSSSNNDNEIPAHKVRPPLYRTSIGGLAANKVASLQIHVRGAACHRDPS